LLLFADKPPAAPGVRLLNTIRSVVKFVVVSTAPPAEFVVLVVTISVDGVMMYRGLALRLKRFEKAMFVGMGILLSSRRFW
jgi:hypothetical protein